MRKRIYFAVVLMAVCLLSGCTMRTVDEMYCLPKRPESYNDLQSVMDAAMVDMDYCAPLTGENQQTVQMADLDGDGIREYLLFAKSSSEMPLQILIFAQNGDEYVHTDTVASHGTGFEVVEYVQMDGKGGVELIVGRQLSGGVLRSVCVYTFLDGQLEQVLSTNYTKILTCDLNDDAYSELMVIRPGQTDTDNGVAELYSMISGTIERSNEAVLSGPADKLKRIITGRLHGGVPAVFVGSSVEQSAIITDVYALVDGVFTNVSLSNESGTSVQTLRNYYVYADDIDGDGEVELPDLITMQPLENGKNGDQQYIIRWYAMGADGSEVNKMYTYHNFVGGWYLQLDGDWASRITVVQEGIAYQFYLWNDRQTKADLIFTVNAFSGQDREKLAIEQNRFVLYKSESTVYAGHLEVASGAVSITQESIISGFHLIRQDWKTGEM